MTSSSSMVEAVVLWYYHCVDITNKCKLHLFTLHYTVVHQMTRSSATLGLHKILYSICRVEFSNSSNKLDSWACAWSCFQAFLARLLLLTLLNIGKKHSKSLIARIDLSSKIPNHYIYKQIRFRNHVTLANRTSA